MLLGKRIIIGVCGGIAAYKSADLTSKLQQAGALVDVILTAHATEFIRPLTFSTVSHRPVYTDLWEPSGQAAAHHIELGTAADLLVVVPATANTIARLAHGLADDLLTTTVLSSTAPLLIVPAMEQHMYQHPATQANLQLLAERGAVIIPPDTGHLASGEVGVGRLPETAALMAAIQKLLGQHGDLAGRRVVVTAGGTAEPIDPVRYIGNRSSGRMGFALAEEARNRGAEVTLIVGTVTVPPPQGIAIQQATTALAMRDAVVTATAAADVLVMAAAVADYRTATAAKEKIKKGSSAENPDGSLTLQLVRNPDILAELASSPSSETLIRVGFAAETTELHQYAVQKLGSKGLDLLIANDVSKEGSGFGTVTDEVVIYSRDGSAEPLPLLPKTKVAEAIWDRIVKLLPGHSELPASHGNQSSESGEGKTATSKRAGT